MPRERPQPPPFEPEWLDRSLNRYLAWGLVFMVLLLAGFVAYRVREPGLRRSATHRADNELHDHRQGALQRELCAVSRQRGHRGRSAPTLNSSQFLKSTSDQQIFALVSGGVSGTEMPAWGIDYGGTFTDEQVRQVTTYLRSLEPKAPSVPGWRQGDKAK